MQDKFDLSDWERRKATLLPVLDAAATSGLVAKEEVGRLAEFLLGRGVAAGHAAPSKEKPLFATGLDTPIASEPPSSVEESENPRFVRGFHDILITIGVIIGLLGLGGLASPYAVIPAVIVLAEILVRRQRLALPAVVLTVAFAGAVTVCVVPLLDDLDISVGNAFFPVIVLAVAAAVSLAFFWRYKVPLALAGGLVAAYATGVGLVLAIMSHFTDATIFDGAHRVVLSALLGVFALLVFLTAMWFDIGDRLRLTRRSDVAFWMHLAGAPAILYTILALVYIPGQQDLIAEISSLQQAAVVVIAVVVLMLIGVVLDRRAFVTSGLLSFGYAFKVLLTEGGLEQLFTSTDTLVFTVLLIVGVLVLSLGIGWQSLRRVVVGVMPPGVRDRVPPVR